MPPMHKGGDPLACLNGWDGWKSDGPVTGAQIDELISAKPNASLTALISAFITSKKPGSH